MGIRFRYWPRRARTRHGRPGDLAGPEAAVANRRGDGPLSSPACGARRHSAGRPPGVHHLVGHGAHEQARGRVRGSTPPRGPARVPRSDRGSPGSGWSPPRPWTTCGCWGPRGRRRCARAPPSPPRPSERYRSGRSGSSGAPSGRRPPCARTGMWTRSRCSDASSAGPGGPRGEPPSPIATSVQRYEDERFHIPPCKPVAHTSPYSCAGTSLHEGLPIPCCRAVGQPTNRWCRSARRRCRAG